MKRDLNSEMIKLCNELHDINFHMDVLESMLTAVHAAMEYGPNNSDEYANAVWCVSDKAFGISKRLKILDTSLDKLTESCRGRSGDACEEVHKK